MWCSVDLAIWAILFTAFDSAYEHRGMAISAIYNKDANDRGALVVFLWFTKDNPPWLLNGIECLNVSYYDNDKTCFKITQAIITCEGIYSTRGRIFTIPCDCPPSAHWITVDLGLSHLGTRMIAASHRVKK